MNKKLCPILILMLTLSPIVAATIGEGIDDTLSLIFDATGDLAYIKAGIWLVLFFLIFKSAEKIFPNNRGAAMMIALVTSMIGARFMPDEYLESIGGGYAILIGIILFLVPFFFGSMIGDLMRWGRGGKTFLIILFYVAFGYSLTRLGNIPFQGEALTALDVVLAWTSEHSMLVLIIIGAICVFFLFRTRSGGGGAVFAPAGMPAEPKPSFWRGLGRGAGGASRWAADRGIGLGGWIARRRAIARQRAMLKSGWAQKKEQLLQQMPRGKVPARGTSGYEEYMKNMIRLDRVRRKLGEQAFLRRMRGKKINI